MIVNATIVLTPLQVREILCKYLEQEGIDVSHQDISFVVEAIECGNQKDAWCKHELKKVEIKNVKLGTGDHTR